MEAGQSDETTGSAKPRTGPLAGIRVVEFAEIGPGQFVAMMMADMGADVIRVERPSPRRIGPEWVVLRGRPTMGLDLKSLQGLETALMLIEQADVIIEGFRPGVMERLGLGPDVALARNPRLIYGRMTGWGQTGPLAQAAGHDLNYIAITGVLSGIGPPDGPPAVPLNLIGDYGGGAMFLLTGILAALIEAQKSGAGQVVDAAMSEGAATLSSFFHYMRAAGRWTGGRGENMLDGGAHFYNVYECADGKHITIAAIEPQFYARLRQLCGLDDPAFDRQHDRAAWRELKEKLKALFLTRTREQWTELLEGTDVCFAPVLDWGEAPSHPHNKARNAFIEVAGVVQPAPSPRFSRTPSSISDRLPKDISPEEALRAWGITKPPSE